MHNESKAIGPGHSCRDILKAFIFCTTLLIVLPMSVALAGSHAMHEAWWCEDGCMWCEHYLDIERMKKWLR